MGRRASDTGSFMKAFGRSPRERCARLAFQRALTDAWFLTDPRFANPDSER